jgi:hypothetical protein
MLPLAFAAEPVGNAQVIYRSVSIWLEPCSVVRAFSSETTGTEIKWKQRISICGD